MVEGISNARKDGHPVIQDIAREMHYKRKMAPSEIATALGRDKSSITRLLCRSNKAMKTGRPKKLTDKQVGRHGLCCPKDLTI